MSDRSRVQRARLRTVKQHQMETLCMGLDFVLGTKRRFTEILSVLSAPQKRRFPAWTRPDWWNAAIPQIQSQHIITGFKPLWVWQLCLTQANHRRSPKSFCFCRVCFQDLPGKIKIMKGNTKIVTGKPGSVQECPAHFQFLPPYLQL